jgi:hypothetical protein
MSSFNFVSFDTWYHIMHQCFFQQLDFDLHYVSGITDSEPYYHINSLLAQNSKHSILFFDQEPIHPELIYHVQSAEQWYFTPGKKFMVTSECSATVDRYTQGMNAQSIYYFFHAIAANEWYHQYRWHRPEYVDHQYLYLSYNNLINPYRAHRIDLLSRLYSKNLVSQGLVSFNSPGLDSLVNTVKACTWYTKESQAIFNEQRSKLTSLTVDTDNIQGYLSATVDLANSRNSMVHIVTETDFYKNKLHLTEKVFKPIVAGQPFLLLAGMGNLEYLRGYGFKTFGDYWDESYDKITDPGERIGAVVDIIENLSNLTHTQQQNMRRDLQYIVEHNFNHLFFDLRKQVVAEFVRNISHALREQDVAFNPADLRQLHRVLVN